MKPQLGEQYKTLIFKESTGTCLSQHIATFKSNGELISQLEIKSECDHDMARPVYETWSYQLNNSERIIYIDRTVESVTDKSLICDSGFLSGGNSFDEVETKTLKQIETYLISDVGKITCYE